jgi:DNA-binding IclR family transcriptional regulator
VEAVNRKNTLVQSVDRAVSMMEYLSRNGWSGVTEVANELGIHKSTAYRLLTTLSDRGLVEQDTATGKYRLGFGVVLLASTVTADLDVLRCARSVCERLSEQTQETVTLTVLEGDDAVIIHQTVPKTTALSVDWTGMHTPLHATAAGKVFLVHMPDDQRRRVLRRPLERFTEKTIVDPGVLRDHIQAVREDGYGYTVEELEVGLNAVGAPIRSSDGAVVASVSVSGSVFRLPVQSIPETAELVKEAATEISRCLGFRG